MTHAVPRYGDDGTDVTDEQAWDYYKLTGCILPGFADTIASYRRWRRAWDRNPEPEPAVES